jgi:hypothetical protein
MPANGSPACRLATSTAAHRDATIAGVETEHDPSRKLAGQRLEQLRPLHRRTAEHDAVDAGRQVGRRRVPRTHATAQLAGHARRLHHAAHEIRLDGHADFGAVEIDDVQPSGPGGHERAGHGDRIISEDGLPIVVALQEPHALAAPQIDRRPEFHGRSLPKRGNHQDARNACSSRSPAAWLFSG